MPTAALRLIAPFILLLLVAVPGARAQESNSSEPYVYEVETIREGLPAPKRPVNLETPQATMEAFLFAGEKEDWLTAAQALDLSWLSPDERAERGEELAEQLYQVVRRAMMVSWEGLPDRPDAVNANAPEKAALAGEPRRNLRLALVKLKDRTVPIRIARLKPEGGEPQWVFTRQTMENVPELYERFGPTALEKKLPAFLRESAFWTLKWWEVVAVPLVLLVALLAALATFAFFRWLKNSPHLSMFDRVVKAVRTPAALLVFAATFAMVQSALFTFSGNINAFINPIQTALIVIAIAALVVALIDALIDRVARYEIEDTDSLKAENDRNFYTLLSAIRRGVLMVILVLGIAFILIQTNISQTLGFSLLASAGVIGLILAFAARTFLANVMASLQIAFAKTARIGDAILFDGKWSYVEKIGFTHLRLRTWDGRRIMAPVTQVVSEAFENWTQQDASLFKYVVLWFDHRADVSKLREAFEAFVEDDEDIVEKQTAKVQVVDHSPAGMGVRFLICAPNPKTGWAIQCRVREHMLKVAAGFDGPAQTTEAPTYLPREREEIVSSVETARSNGAAHAS